MADDDEGNRRERRLGWDREGNVNKHREKNYSESGPPTLSLRHHWREEKTRD